VVNTIARENYILGGLNVSDRHRLLRESECVSLPTGSVLYRCGDHISHVFLPRGGLVSLLAVTCEGETIEVAAVGREGLVGVCAVLGATTAQHDAVVRIPLVAVKIRADLYAAELQQCKAIQVMTMRHANDLLNQAAQLALCSRYHTVKQRLSRLLLDSCDRLGTRDIQYTQELLSSLIGASRTTITEVACELQRTGWIHYLRGRIRILDPAALELTSCKCYRTARVTDSHLNHR